jgi:hypothetical protein
MTRCRVNSGGKMRRSQKNILICKNCFAIASSFPFSVPKSLVILSVSEGSLAFSRNFPDSRYQLPIIPNFMNFLKWELCIKSSSFKRRGEFLIFPCFQDYAIIDFPALLRLDIEKINLPSSPLPR